MEKSVLRWSRTIYSALILLALGLSSACSPVGFSHDSSCGAFGNQACVVNPQGLKHFDNTIEVGDRPVDILFVNDNSGSMSVEQQKMGEKFPNFIESLDGIDFNIAMTTTDVSSQRNLPRAANGNGALQDGRLIAFPNNKLVLNSTMSNIGQMFLDTIMRPETVSCDNSGFQPDSCPSSDERGIFAANLAVSRADPNFFRPNAHLAVVILSDEDERSDSGEIPGFPLEYLDTPPSLISNVKKYLGADKTLSAHAVVIRPNDQACLNQQRSQENVRGFYGMIYADLAEMTNGTVGSICSDDYGAEMDLIGSNIVEQVNSVELACAPVGDEVGVIVLPEPANFEFLVDSDNRRVWFNQNLPKGTTARVVYDCAAD